MVPDGPPGPGTGARRAVAFVPVTFHTVDVATPAPDGLPVVGMVGGGQLARMTHQAAIALGQSLRVLAASPGDPAALVCADVHLGSPDDLDALRGLADGCEVVTFDHEDVPGELLRALVADGVAVRPSPDALRHAQDKLVMRRALAGLAGMPDHVAGHRPRRRGRVRPPAPAGRWCSRRCRGGYDGRGVWLLDGPDPGLVAQLLAAGTPLMAEQRGDDAPRAGRAGGAVAVRAGGGVAGGGDGAARRAVRRGARPGAGPVRGHRRGRPAARPADRRPSST